MNILNTDFVFRTATRALNLAVILTSLTARADLLYVTDYGANNVRRFDTVSGADLGIFVTNGLIRPTGLAFDSAGNLFVASSGNNTIMKFTPDGIGSVFASRLTDPMLNAPQGLAFDTAGNLYVPNWYGTTVEKFTPEGVGSTFGNGLKYPCGLAFDAAGNLFVANNDDTSRILKFTPDGVGSLFSTSSFFDPHGLAFDASGNLYLANANSRNIERLTPQGIRTVFISGLRAPLSLEFDRSGNLFVVNEAQDPDANFIERFAADGTYLGVFTSSGIKQPFFIAFQTPSPPVIDCSSPLILECTNGAVATLHATVKDNTGASLQVIWKVDGTPMQTNTIPSQGNVTRTNLTLTASFELGHHAVVVAASNGLTEPAICTTTVTVVDTSPPQILNVQATPNLLWPPNHRMVPVRVTVEALDNCDPSPSVRIVEVKSNEPRRPSMSDWEITGDQTLKLRAERLGNGKGRVYTIVVRCEDANGNATLGSVDVVVPHN